MSLKLWTQQSYPWQCDSVTIQLEVFLIRRKSAWKKNARWKWTNNNNTYFSIREKHAHGNITCSQGWRTEMRTTEIKWNKRMSANLSYSKSILENGIRCGKTMRKIQVCQWETVTGKLISQGYTEFSGAVCRQRITSHFMVECIKYAHFWRKTWPQHKDGCRDVAGVPKRQVR